VDGANCFTLEYRESHPGYRVAALTAADDLKAAMAAQAAATEQLLNRQQALARALERGWRPRREILQKALLSPLTVEANDARP
jgi:hypothetical protein